MSDEIDLSSDLSAGTARIEDLLFGCLDEGEAHLEDAVAKLCATNPDLATAIRDEVEAARSAGLTRPPPALDASAPPPADTDYQPIGPYQPLAELGRGGQGLVYLAEDTRLHRVVALKILKGFGPLSEKMMQRFKREAEVASKLDHPGICSVYDAGVKDGIPYIAMRFVEGKTLGDSIRHARASVTPEPSIASFLDLDEVDEPDDAPTDSKTPTATTTKADVLKVVQIVEKAARALHAAHEAGIIHRDVKPGNIFNVSFNGTVPVRSVVEAIAMELGLLVTNIEAISAGDTVTDWAPEFSAEATLNALTEPRGITWGIDGSVLRFDGAESQVLLPGQVELNEGTGLMGSPAIMRRAAGDDEVVGARATSVLNANIQVGSKVVLKSEFLEGTYRTIAVTHTGDTWLGPWQSELEMELL